MLFNGWRYPWRRAQSLLLLVNIDFTLCCAVYWPSLFTSGLRRALIGGSAPGRLLKERGTLMRDSPPEGRMPT